MNIYYHEGTCELIYFRTRFSRGTKFREMISTLADPRQIGVSNKHQKQNTKKVPDGTIVHFDGLLWSSPSACFPFYFRPGGEGRAANKSEGGRGLVTYSVNSCFSLEDHF